MTHVIILVGDLGGGKTTLAKVLGMIAKAGAPDNPVISNVVMGSGIHNISNVHGWMAKKLLVRNKTYVCVLDDEAAQAGLEARGSGSKAAALETRVITHARKAHCDLVLVTQLKSMIDKRAQWVEDLSVLCEAVFEEGNLTSLPDYFHYTVYDKWVEEIGQFDIETLDCIRYIWPGMDTDDIPDFDKFKSDMMAYYAIKEEDLKKFAKDLDLPYPMFQGKKRLSKRGPSAS